MRSLLFVTLLFSACATQSTSASSPTKSGQKTLAEADTMAETKTLEVEALEAKLMKIVEGVEGSTGMSVSVFRAGQNLETLNVGTVAPKGSAVDDETRFSVQSVSKLFTAAKVHALVAEDKLALSDPVTKYLPKARFLFEDQNVEISVEDLLSHQAGLPSHPANFDPTKRGVQWQDSAFYSKMLSQEWQLNLQQAPGSYSYSNLGYGLLGAIIEVIEDCDYRVCMQKHLVRLGVKDATFDSSLLEQKFAFGQSQQGETRQSLPAPWYASAYASPFGGLWITTAALNDFGQVLLQASSDTRHSLHRMTAPTKKSLGPAFRKRGQHLCLEHDGSGPGFLAWLIVVPQKQMVVSLAINGETRGKTQSEEFAANIDALMATLFVR